MPCHSKYQFLNLNPTSTITHCSRKPDVCWQTSGLRVENDGITPLQSQAWAIFGNVVLPASKICLWLFLRRLPYPASLLSERHLNLQFFLILIDSSTFASNRLSLLQQTSSGHIRGLGQAHNLQHRRRNISQHASILNQAPALRRIRHHERNLIECMTSLRCSLFVQHLLCVTVV